MSGFTFADMQQAIRDGGLSLKQQCDAIAEIELQRGTIEDLREALRRAQGTAAKLELEVKALTPAKFVGGAR